jgi:hypothetical protein
MRKNNDKLYYKSVSYIKITSQKYDNINQFNLKLAYLYLKRVLL